MIFLLDNKPLSVDCPSTLEFTRGDTKCLSEISCDPTSGCDWYCNGFTIQSFESIFSHQYLYSSIECLIKDKLVSIFPSKDFSDFTLGKYHDFVNEREHSSLADPLLKRLYVKDLPEIAEGFAGLISEMLGFPMGFTKSTEDSEHWIIVRINPPYSYAYNPPHKDVYEDFDLNGHCPSMVNVWIPIVGVNELAGLGLAPKSHLLPESDIVRSKSGAEMNGKKFSVNFIKSWGNSNLLTNVYPPVGKLLCFSSHLVHGLGINRNPELTRVALELRLHRVRS